MKRQLIIAALLALAVAPARAQAPWSELSGELTGQANPDRASIIILAVDGSMNIPYRNGYVHLAPGGHQLHLASSRRGRRGEIYYETVVFDLAPCMRYRLAAEHGKSTRVQAWKLVIVKEEPIPRCLQTNPGTSNAPESGDPVPVQPAEPVPPR